MDISNTEPIFMNYEEFFVDRVYDVLPLENQDVVLDIGANVGLWTKYILSKGAGKVYCFEPNLKAIDHLKNTLKEDINTHIEMINASSGIYIFNRNRNWFCHILSKRENNFIIVFIKK